MRQWGTFGAVHGRYGMAGRGGIPGLRTVLTVPEFDRVVNGLQQWVDEARPMLEAGEQAALWLTERGGRVAVKEMELRFAWLRREAGLNEALTMHCLRHSYATHLIEFGYSERFVTEQVGHSYASTTAIYTSVSSDFRTKTLKAALSRVNTDLLAAIGILPPYEPAIARMLPWLDDELADELPAEEARLVNRFARWRVLRRLRNRAERGELTKAMIDRGRIEIIEAIRFLAWARRHGESIDTTDQEVLDRYFLADPSRVDTLCTFLNWLPPRAARTKLELPTHRQSEPIVTGSDEDRWANVELLLGDDTIRLYVRIAGLFTLLFARPLTSICRMSRTQVDDHRPTVNRGAVRSSWAARGRLACP